MSARELKRSSGILLPLFALPSKYGIGSLGAEARAFIDFLSEARQSWWQLLPLGCTSCGDSPYQCLSTFAGNSYYIDLEELVSEGLLKEAECPALFWGAEELRVDYGALYKNRPIILRKAFERARGRYSRELKRFREENAFWLEDFALYMALKRLFSMRAFGEWPRALRQRKPWALKLARAALKDDIEYHIFVQYLFFRQWAELKAYARERGVGLIGDLPIYVAMDSSEVWASPQYFVLDEKGLASEVAGVPPDYFSAEGQLWGNPLYNWEKLKAEGYGWWKRRTEAAAGLFDGVRIDHFRGFESYWAVPAGEENAKKGRWLKGPG
ncbi:MAG: 4-alpha-glucanotransferase, partial [Oscillospiraceae bacterium]|nr:4-alpha-glucanotransferase [Oscillospiraceae bacterium]